MFNGQNAVKPVYQPPRRNVFVFRVIAALICIPAQTCQLDVSHLSGIKRERKLSCVYLVDKWFHFALADFIYLFFNRIANVFGVFSRFETLMTSQCPPSNVLRKTWIWSLVAARQAAPRRRRLGQRQSTNLTVHHHVYVTNKVASW